MDQRTVGLTDGHNLSQRCVVASKKGNEIDKDDDDDEEEDDDGDNELGTQTLFQLGMK